MPERSDQWLSLEQILRRTEVLRNAMTLLEREDRAIRVPRKGRDTREHTARLYQRALITVARDAIRQAQHALGKAEKSAWTAGGAPVPCDALELVTVFNRLGPARLAALLQSDHRGPESSSAIPAPCLKVDRARTNRRV